MERICTAGFLAIVAMGVAGMAGMAVRSSTVEVAGQWVNTASAAADAHHGYFTLVNRGPAARRLLRVESPFYDSATLEAGYAKLTQPVAIAPGAKIEFQPSGPFAAFKQPIRILKKGSQVPLVLVFENGERVSVRAPLKVVSSAPLKEAAKRTRSGPPLKAL